MLPLGNHAVIRATTLDELSEIVTTHFGAFSVLSPNGAAPCDVKVNHCELPTGQLWSASTALPLAVKFPESDDLRLQFRFGGTGQIAIGSKQVPVSAASACITNAEAISDCGAGFERLVWQIPRALLVRKLAALTGRAVTCGLIFNPVIDLAAPEGRNLQNILACLADAADMAKGSGARLMLTELEQAMAVALLCGSDHSHRHLLDRSRPSSAPWQVHRVESYIEANWSQPLRMEDIVAITGASARSIFRTFADHRGYSPMDFLKRIRLQHAREMLVSDEPGVTVTDVALSCGFVELSRFSKDFRDSFGMLPSQALKHPRNRPTSRIH
jgi:AraC-like DNA-binding protein